MHVTAEANNKPLWGAEGRQPLHPRPHNDHSVLCDDRWITVCLVGPSTLYTPWLVMFAHFMLTVWCIVSDALEAWEEGELEDVDLHIAVLIVRKAIKKGGEGFDPPWYLIYKKMNTMCQSRLSKSHGRPRHPPCSFFHKWLGYHWFVPLGE